MVDQVSKAVEGKYSRQKWTDGERAIISSTLTDGISIEAIKKLLDPNRSETSLIREVHKTNHYSIRTMDDGRKRFYSDIKRRNRGKTEESAEAASVETTASAEKNVDNNQQDIIVPKKVVDTGKELRLMALDLLFRENLIITDQSVKQAAKLLSQFTKEVSA